MKTLIKLFSNKEGEILRFLNHFYASSQKEVTVSASLLEWEISFENPIEMADMLGVFIDNKDDYDINMWICLDKDVLINVTPNNVDELICYLYERFPY